MPNFATAKRLLEKMIRPAELSDAAAIADIYNGYITESVASFETEPLSVDEMRRRMEEISGSFPYFVFVCNGELAGYCYAHPWKERAAYCRTLETTIYLAPGFEGRGIGTQLMERLIEACREQGYTALIACITGGNEASQQLHRKLGFKQVSQFEKVGYKFGQYLDVTDFQLLL